MKARLAIFVAALLLLPMLALSLASYEWPQAHMIVGNVALPLLFSALTLLAISLLLDVHTQRCTSFSLLHKQRGYLLWNAAAGALSGMLLAYLNLYLASWISPATSIAEMLMLSALTGAIMLPAVLITRLWLASFAGLSRNLAHLPVLPSLAAEPVAALLLLLALVGLMGGVVWPMQVFWLMWLAPLLLLAALQLLWHESTVFSGMKQGDWSRVVLGGLSGALLGGLAIATYKFAGGALYFNLPLAWTPALLFAYGLLSLQLADILAENWRGKTLTQIYQSKKPFPVQVVTKKD